MKKYGPMKQLAYSRGLAVWVIEPIQSIAENGEREHLVNYGFKKGISFILRRRLRQLFGKRSVAKRTDLILTERAWKP